MYWKLAQFSLLLIFLSLFSLSLSLFPYTPYVRSPATGLIITHARLHKVFPLKSHFNCTCIAPANRSISIVKPQKSKFASQWKTLPNAQLH